MGLKPCSLQAILEATLRATQGKRKVLTLLHFVVGLGQEQCNRTERQEFFFSFVFCDVL